MLTGRQKRSNRALAYGCVRGSSNYLSKRKRADPKRTGKQYALQNPSQLRWWWPHGPLQKAKAKIKIEGLLADLKCTVCVPLDPLSLSQQKTGRFIKSTTRIKWGYSGTEDTRHGWGRRRHAGDESTHTLQLKLQRPCSFPNDGIRQTFSNKLNQFPTNGPTLKEILKRPQAEGRWSQLDKQRYKERRAGKLVNLWKDLNEHWHYGFWKQN